MLLTMFCTHHAYLFFFIASATSSLSCRVSIFPGKFIDFRFAVRGWTEEATAMSVCVCPMECFDHI